MMMKQNKEKDLEMIHYFFVTMVTLFGLMLILQLFIN